MSQEKKDIVNEIATLIKEGLVKGYKQNIFFTQNYSDLQSRVIEYLIVVNIAQTLENLAQQRGIQINLEYSLNDFYNNAFPSYISTGEIFATDVKKRGNHSPKDSKSKRLDIVLTEENKVAGEIFTSYKSFVGIEVKSINQHHKKIKKDVQRLATAMSLVDSVGTNNIEVCFACFFRRFDNDSTTISKDEIKIKDEFEKKYWKDYFESIEKDYPTLSFELIPTIVANLPVENFSYTNPEIDYEYSDLLENSGYVSAYIIKIFLK